MGRMSGWHTATVSAASCLVRALVLGSGSARSHIPDPTPSPSFRSWGREYEMSVVHGEKDDTTLCHTHLLLLVGDGSLGPRQKELDGTLS